MQATMAIGLTRASRADSAALAALDFTVLLAPDCEDGACAGAFVGGGFVDGSGGGSCGAASGFAVHMAATASRMAWLIAIWQLVLLEHLS
jgi:hypothetical protein